MSFADLLIAVGVGLAGGLSSGLLGVSPGGALVVFSVLLLGAEQHVAQGVSLAAQVVPNGLAGVRRHQAHGLRSPKRWLAWLGVGFIFGGALGALAATRVGAEPLRWTYVAYLAVLDVLLITRARRGDSPSTDVIAEPHPHWGSLLTVGLLAGVSSGFLGIGGGLAATVGLSVCLGVAQHQAQMVSLVISLLPTTAPSAWVYWRAGWMSPWPVLAGVILGLVVGTDVGARAATRNSGPTLRAVLLGLVSVMTIYMTYKALRGEIP